MDTVTGWVAGSPDVETFTAAGLVAQLQARIDEDPTVADLPVTIWTTVGGRFVPSVVGLTGHDDPSIGGHRQVYLLAHGQATIPVVPQ